ncbi:MAG: AAA family ATPase [Bacteroidales bacterium]
MLSDFLIGAFKTEFAYEPTPDQALLFEKLADFILDKDKDGVLIINGYAGTGKTYCISAVVKVLKKVKINCVLMAPTGRASKVFSQYSEHSAFTIHKKIYRQKSSSDGFGQFLLDRNLYKNTFFIVDEASMISDSNSEYSAFGSGKLLSDLIEYVYTGSNCKLILIGDTAQLPPVGIDISPALDIQVLNEFNLKVEIVQLTQVVRQSLQSGILLNATELRNQIENTSLTGRFPKLNTNNRDVIRIQGENLIEEISNAYDKFGKDNVIIINRSNKRANKYNQGIRNSILYRESRISAGDMIMIVKNNYFWSQKTEEIDFIANGDIAEIVRIFDYQDLYGFNFADVRLRMPDYNDIEIDVKIILNAIEIESASLSVDENKNLYTSVLEDYPELTTKKQKFEKMRENEYFNALQVKFAYAITCHKSQGGQWKVVFLDQGYITEEMLGKEYYRWLYTAFTRSVEKIYLVNFSDDYF